MAPYPVGDLWKAGRVAEAAWAIEMQEEAGVGKAGKEGRENRSYYLNG